MQSEIVIVPVRVSSIGTSSPSVCRRPDGVRTGLAFSSAHEFRRVMGAGCPAVTVSLPALRRMLAAIGVDAVQVDPEALIRPAAGLSAVS